MAGEKRQELADIAFVAGQDSVLRTAHHEELVAVFAGQRRSKGERAGGQPDRFAVCPAEESRVVW